MTEPVAAVKVRLNKVEAEADAGDFRTSLQKTFSSDTTDKLSSAVTSFGGKAKAAWETVTAAYQAAEAVLQRIVGVYHSEAVAGAVAEEQANLRLATALRIRGEAGSEVARARAEEAEVLERLLGIETERTVDLESQLVLLGVQTEMLGQARDATIGLAEVTGKDLHAAARDVAAVIRGDTTRAIRQLGLDGLDAETVLARLAANMGIAQERADSFGGRIERMDGAIEDMLEPLGEAVTRSSTWSGGLDTLRLSALGVKEVLGDLADTLVDNFLVGAAGDALDFLTGPVRLRGFEAEAAAREAQRKAAEERSRAEQDRMRATQAAGGGIVGELFNRNFAGLKFDEPEVIIGQSSQQKSAANEAARELARAEQMRERVAQMVREVDEIITQNVLSMELQATPAIARLIDQEQAAADKRVEIERITAISVRAVRGQASDQAIADAKRQKDGLLKVENEISSTLLSSVQGFAASIAQTVGAATQGQLEGGQVLRQAAGGAISMIGTMLFQLGSAGVLAGTLGTVIPFFRTLTGAELGIGAGLAAMTGGLGMIAIGSALGASSSAPSAPSTSAGGGRASAPSSRTEADNFNFGLQPAGAAGAGSPMFIIQYFGGVHGGDPRATAREFSDTLRRNSLVPGRRIMGSLD